MSVIPWLYLTGFAFLLLFFIGSSILLAGLFGILGMTACAYQYSLLLDAKSKVDTANDGTMQRLEQLEQRKEDASLEMMSLEKLKVAQVC